MFSIIDIDDFKSINDNHGHVFGDEVLKYVADILRNACRSNDITGRLGGDEFVMLFRADFTREEAGPPFDIHYQADPGRRRYSFH